METRGTERLAQAIAWCASQLGPVELLTDHSKVHGGHESTICRLRTSAGHCYLKIHESREHWENEVHAYEQWVHAFGIHAPRMMALCDTAPLSLVVSEVAGSVAETVALSPAQSRLLWFDAGRALAALHGMAVGPCFGPCRRDGSCTDESPMAADAYVTARFAHLLARGVDGEYLDACEVAVLEAALSFTPAFAGEQPAPCHRDYCTANWLVDEQGVWAGLIDFEFAHWDVRVADFSRDPNWTWMVSPDLFDSLLEGYGRPLSPREEQQLLVARAEYALGAIVWGRDNAFFGFEREGRAALAHLARALA